MDADLEQMTRDQLIAEIKKLRNGIREHRDSSEHELCWRHPALWNLLPEKTDPLPVVPEWPEFLRGCIRYRQSLDQQAPTRHEPRSHTEGKNGGPSCGETIDPSAPVGRPGLANETDEFEGDGMGGIDSRRVLPIRARRRGPRRRRKPDTAPSGCMIRAHG